MRYLLIALLLVVSCTPKQAIVQQVPDKVIVNYLPEETTKIIDTSYVNTTYVRDTVNEKDTVVITKTRWRETVKTNRVIDTIPKYLVHTDTITKKTIEKIPAWKWRIIFAAGAFFGMLLMFTAYRLLNRQKHSN